MSTNQQGYHQYAHKAEDIPLGKVDSLDEEQKNYYSQQRQQDFGSHHNNNRDSVNSIYQVKSSKFSLFIQPLISVVLSAFFSIALLLLFLYADGKPLDFAILGMKIPSLVSLLLTINAVFLASGISKAVAEYKWVKLQNGAPLTTIDVYDSCTRGLSGFLLTLRAFQLDLVLIVALTFHIGLLVVSPASQAVLVPIQKSYNRTGVDATFYFNKASYYLGRSGLSTTGQPPRMNGLLNNGYITTASFTQAATGSKPVPTFECPSDSSYCLYPNISFITTTMSCQNITGKDTALVWYNSTNFVVVLDEYFTKSNMSGSTIGAFPKFLHSTEMRGYTSFELDNYTLPLLPGLGIPTLFASRTEYDPQYRPYVGPQSFVMAYKTASPMSESADNYTELSYRQCSFLSSLNTSDWMTMNGTLVKTGRETSVPITLDFDRVLGNNVALSSDALSANQSNAIMVNAYVMQQALLKELVRRPYYTFRDYLNGFNLMTPDHFKDIKGRDLFEPFMKEALAAFDYSFFQSPFVSGKYNSLLTSPTAGVAFFTLQPEYKVDKTFAYIICMCLLLPIFWWLIIWAYSLKKNNGVSRANSQIVLLATNMTPNAERTLRGFSNLDSNNAFDRAKNIRIRLGNVRQQTVVGMEHENDLRPLV